MQYQLLINGVLVDGEGERQSVYNPATGEVILEIAEASPVQVDAAVLAADSAFAEWGQTTPKARAECLLKLADSIEQNALEFARLESQNCGKPLHCVINDEIPAIVDVFRFFAGAARCLSGLAAGEYLEGHTSMIRRDPIGVVASIAPWNYPLMMAAWKLAPALAAGNCVVLKPARLTPLSVLLLMEVIGDLLPPGVVNVVNGAGGEIGEYLATSKRIAKVAFTGSTEVGQQIMQYATQNIIPVTLELGGKSPNIFFADVMDEEDAFFDKALEGFALFAFNQGEVCTCPSRALVQESIYERFMERAIRRVESIRSGNPLDSGTQMGAQVSHGQLETILNYIDIGKKEGADILTGGRRKELDGELKEGYYLEPTILFGKNNMRVFQEEIFGPVLAVTTFKTMEKALEIANDTQYGLGAGVWSRNGNLAYKMGRGIQAGRVWTNCYHAYPAHAAFGGYKQSGIGRETHKMMLEHYQQTKCLLVSYSDKPLGLF